MITLKIIQVKEIQQYKDVYEMKRNETKQWLLLDKNEHWFGG